MTAEDLFQYFDFKHRRYFYHITENGVGEIMCEEGLLMADSHIYSTMIEITPSLLKNGTQFINDEFNDSRHNQLDMVIIAVDKGQEKWLIQDNKHGNLSWNSDDGADYYVSPDYILGYIDLSSPDYQFTSNPNCFADELADLDMSR